MTVIEQRIGALDDKAERRSEAADRRVDEVNRRIDRVLEQQASLSGQVSKVDAQVGDPRTRVEQVASTTLDRAGQRGGLLLTPPRGPSRDDAVAGERPSRLE